MPNHCRKRKRRMGNSRDGSSCACTHSHPWPRTKQLLLAALVGFAVAIGGSTEVSATTKSDHQRDGSNIELAAEWLDISQPETTHDTRALDRNDREANGGTDEIYKVRIPARKIEVQTSGETEAYDLLDHLLVFRRLGRALPPHATLQYSPSAFAPSRPWKPTSSSTFYHRPQRPSRRPTPSSVLPSSSTFYYRPQRPSRRPTPSSVLPPAFSFSEDLPPAFSEDLPPAFSLDQPTAAPSCVATLEPTTEPSLTFRPTATATPTTESERSERPTTTESPDAAESPTISPPSVPAMSSQPSSEMQEPTISAQPSAPTISQQPSVVTLDPAEITSPTAAPSLPQSPSSSSASPSSSGMPSSALEPPEPMLPTVSQAPSAPTVSPAPSTSVEPSSAIEPQLPTISPAPTSPTVSSAPSTGVQPPPVLEPQLPTISPEPTSPTVSAQPSAVVQPQPVSEPQLPTVSPAPTAPTISPMPSPSSVEPPSLEPPTPDEPFIPVFPTVSPAPVDPSEAPTDGPRCITRANLVFCPEKFVTSPPPENCDCYNFCGDEFVGCCNYDEECKIDCLGFLTAGCERPPVKNPTRPPQPPVPQAPSPPTPPPVPTSMPSASPTSMCSVAVNEDLCSNVTANQEPIEGCDCYNYCNGEFNGCCGFLEAVECEQDCSGTVVSGCQLDMTDVNATISPNATNAPNNTAPPTTGEPQPPGGGGGEPPQPPGGGGGEPPQPPGGSGNEPTDPPIAIQPPGGGNPQPPGGGGEPAAPGGGGGNPPGSRQFDNDDLSVTLPPFALRFFLPNQQEAEEQQMRPDFFVPNRYPSQQDYIALESLTDVFVKNYIMETIGNGLNVVLDDFRTIALSKPGVANKDSVTEVEVTRAGPQDLLESTPEQVSMPFESLYIVFASTAVFDSASPTLPHPYTLLQHVQEAFTGESLMGYLSMLQALQHDITFDGGSFFSLTTDVLWVATNSKATDGNGDSELSAPKSSSDLGPLIAVFSIAIIILFMMILRLQFGMKCWSWKRDDPMRRKLSEFEGMFTSSSSVEVYEIENEFTGNEIGLDGSDKLGSSLGQDNAGDSNTRQKALDPPGYVLETELQGSRSGCKAKTQSSTVSETKLLRRLKKGVFT